MNYPAASCGVSSSVLARHSVLDTESSLALWIPASAGMTNSRQAAGNEPPVDSTSISRPPFRSLASFLVRESYRKRGKNERAQATEGAILNGRFRLT